MSTIVRVYPLSWNSLVLTLLVVCSLVLDVADATIRVDDLGKEYQSRPDQYVGLQMQKETEYKARLQRIPGDQHFCGNRNWNVTVPDDGLPVAMVVKKGVCSFAQKAEFASQNIFPKGIVKVLIIDGEIKIADDEDDDQYKYEYNREYEHDRFYSSKPLEENLPLSSYMNPSYYNNIDGSEISLKRKHADDITVTILHVSYRTGYELLEILLKEDAGVKESGGTYVTVDGDVPSMTRAVIILWTVVSFVVSLCCCCCMASAIEDLFEEPEPEPLRRPRRKRLTRDQVRQFPIGIFDGTRLVYDDDDDCDIDNELGDDHEQAAGNKLCCIQPATHSLDACAICLDDYEVGDQLRCLPCGHTFHAKCIAKWLIERSATCPLCNLDLYEEEEFDEDEDETETNQRANATVPTTIERENSTVGSWWRSIFRSPEERGRMEANNESSLTEPLLPRQQEQEQTEETPSVEDAATVEDPPSSDESSSSNTIPAGSDDDEENIADGSNQ